MSEIPKFDDPVILIGGADVDMSLLNRLSHLPIVAADGGANHLRNTNLLPEMIIGDVDSLQDYEHWQSVTHVKKIAEQDTTDLEKCLYSTDASLYIALGFIGGRLDHTLATLHTVQKYHPRKSVILAGSEDLILIFSASVKLPLPTDTRVSVYPLSQTVFTSSRGLQYPLDGLKMMQGELIGTSNKSSEDSIEIQAERGVFALILPVKCLPSVLAEYQVSAI